MLNKLRNMLHWKVGAMGLSNLGDTSLWNIITHFEICAGDQIKYCRTVDCNFSKDNLFNRLMNYSNFSSDCISISNLIS